ncbi:Na+/H+ antiporter NhaC family protein [Calidifontibacillus oryziterrae]|uniref:Na+/H+ antiporter NhaC family protein n=1 Tax=Calidifontibacillus oryziterrae TaxID=1191699 RepID=UPI0002E84B4D|nr:Na+/H+ antiporter NhaC family protein [Calidifontibacillus oryziterrae]
MEGTVFSLLPPLVAIVMVILTRKTLLSLGVGILTGALLLNDFSVIGTLDTIMKSAIEIFASVNEETSAFEANTWNIYIILFLLLLGIMTAFISITGGSRAFGEWAMKRVKTRMGAHVVTVFLGIIIFIDDYFNALAVGQISRPLTDRHKISRAKLAYLIDSTSAPVCVISPISSWGAYIIALIGSLLVTHQVADVSAFSAFVQMIPMNLYVIAAFILIFAVSIFNINIGAMKVHEARALKTGEVVDPERKDIPGELKGDLPVSNKGKIADLVIPIVVLVIGTVGSMFLTGAKATEGTVTILAIFENTDVATSLFYGGIIGVIVTIFMYLRHNMRAAVLPKGVWEGIKSMLPAVYILLFAWVIIDIIGSLETGKYLAGIVENSNMNISYLPAILFVISGLMAFATGTSWGTFGIMLPIAGDIVAATDITLLLPTLAAVLAGSVFGDHCSPISDTTILSSTGAGSHHIDHVLTQLPYALTSALAACIGYIITGITNSWVTGMISTIAIVVMIIILLLKRTRIAS